MKLKLLTIALLLGSFLQSQEITITTPTIKMVTSINDLKSIKNPKSGDLTIVTNSSGVTKYLYDGSKWVSLSVGGSVETYVGLASTRTYPRCPRGWIEDSHFYYIGSYSTICKKQ